MHNLRRFLICCLIWVGMLPGRHLLKAQSTPLNSPAARAQAELERQAQEYWRKESAQSGSAQQPLTREQEEKARAMAASRKKNAKPTVAPGPKVEYATNPRPARKTELTPEEKARQERIAAIEREVERRRAERRGERPEVRPVSNAAVAIAVPSVPPPVPGTPTPVAAPAAAPVPAATPAPAAPVAQTASAAPSGLGAEQDRKARELLRATVADMEKEKASKPAPSPYTPAQA
ncbi:MAG TPA: hypothetical protein DCM86_20180, partial [Verrucomicrobiales bacterium]|nr:hypothetical protein [Verrucomicrobiales bacterium]